MPVANEGDAYYKGTTPITRIYAGTTEIWPQVVPIVLTVTSSRWDLQDVSWNDVGEVDDYVLYLGGTEVYRGQGLSYSATGLTPSTSYGWRIDAIKFGVVRVTDTETASTLARTAPDVLVTSPGWDQANIFWTDSDKGSVDRYVVKEGSTVLYDGPGNSVSHTGLMPNSVHNYSLESYRGSTFIPPNVLKSRTTLARTPPTLTTSTPGWDQINISWSDPDKRSIDRYVLKEGSTVLYDGPGNSVPHTRLLPSTAHTYTLESYRVSTLIPPNATKAQTTAAYADPGLVGSSPAWWCNDLSWSDPSQRSVDYYVLLYNGARIYENYASAGKSFRHQNLVPSAGYGYTLECWRLAPDTLIKTDTVSVTTAGRSLSLSGWAPQYNYAHLDWADSDGSTLTHYHLWRDGVGYTWIDPGARAYDDWGVGEGQYHTYQIQGYRDSDGTGFIAPASNVVGITQPTRPRSYSNIWGLGTGQYSWTECTQLGLTAIDFNFPVNGYVTGFNMAVAGYTPDGGRFNPDIDGYLYGWRPGACGACSYPSGVQWAWVGTGDHYLNAGGHHLGTSVGGDCNKTQWYVCCGNHYSHPSIAFGQIDYWWYAAREADDQLRTQPWWNEVLADRTIHLDLWQTPTGETIAARVRDLETGVQLVEWGEVPVVSEDPDPGGRPPGGDE